MAKKIEEARVRQKADTLENWNNNDLPLLDGEQAFIRSDVDDMNIGFKLGSKNKKFSELPYPDYSVRGKVSPSSTWTGRQSGVYIPTLNGTYNGITVNLGEGYQVLYWDGTTLEKVVYPADFTGLVFGGVIDDSADLSNPTEAIWYIASAGTYNTDPEITLTEQSILTWNSKEWSHVPFELEVRGEFLVADNVEELRNITPQVASLLTNGTYKGLTLLGYYEKGDTPSEINYYVSDTTDIDNGGSIFEVAGIKLEHKFIDYIDVRYFGASPDVSNNLPFLKKSQSTGNNLYISAGTYLVDVSSSNFLSLSSNQVLTFEKGATLEVVPNSRTNYDVIRLDSVSNVVINGGVLKGDADKHLTTTGNNTYKRYLNNTNYSVGDYVVIQSKGFIVTTSGTTGATAPNVSGTAIGQTVSSGGVIFTMEFANLGEWGMGITVTNGCQNISINGTIFSSFWGDGIYVGGGTSTNINKNIFINNVTSDNNRRQGLSITHVDGLAVKSSSFTNTHGTNPECGIDLEPNNGQKVINILLDDLVLSGNSEVGIKVYNEQRDNADLSKITIRNTRSFNNKVGIVTMYAFDISIYDSKFNENTAFGCEIPRDTYAMNCYKVEFNNNGSHGVSAVATSQNIGIRNINFYASNFDNNGTTQTGDGFRLDLPTSSGTISNINFYNCSFSDNKTVKTQRYGISKPNLAAISNINLLQDCYYNNNVTASRSGLFTNVQVSSNLNVLMAGTTANRPTPTGAILKDGQPYTDLALSKIIFWDPSAASWKDAIPPAQPSFYGTVRQSTATSDVTSTLPPVMANVGATYSQSEINTLVANYNQMRTLCNELLQKFNNKLATDRSSGQQAT